MAKFLALLALPDLASSQGLRGLKSSPRELSEANWMPSWPSFNLGSDKPVDLQRNAPAVDVWWKTAQPEALEATTCLMRHRYGCDKIRHEQTCLGSVDGRAEELVDGFKTAGQQCVWCGGMPCRSGSSNLCEPLDYLMSGEGKAFAIFYTKATYQVATCLDGKPAPAQKIFRQPPLPTPPPTLQIDNSWWKTQQLSSDKSACLMEHRYGCNVIRHRETCLGSRDARDMDTLNGLKIRGQPCVWCGGGPCTTTNATVCEPLAYLMEGEGKVFSSFLGKATYQVAECKDGAPMPFQAIFRHLPLPPVPTLAPWWIPASPPSKETMDCLAALTTGCFAAKTMGECLTSKDASTVSMESGLAVSGQACIWCGGGPCTSNSSALCAPYDYALRGEGTAFKFFYPKTTYQVASCLTRTVELPTQDFACLAEADQGCTALTDAASCLASRDGRDIAETDGGLKVQGQPCVWCGGVACTSGSANKCAPFDWVMNGQGQAFQHHSLSPAFYRLAGCKNNKPAALNFQDYAKFVGGYIPPLLEAAPLVPFWVPDKPAPEALTCLKAADSGCNSLKSMEACMSSKDGRSMPDLMGMKIAGEPCVWCGGLPCTTNSSSLCEPFDYVMYGQGKAFADFSAKGIYKVAGCDKGDIELPQYDYACLEASGSGGCGDLWNAEECLASKDGRDLATVGVLQLKDQPCVWCGGGACHSGKTSMCEAFDYAVNGEGRAFARFHAQGTYRLAACQGGRPKAATLQNFTDFVPGYTSKPLPLPTIPPRAKWWIPERPAEANITCLETQPAGCSALSTMGSCLNSRDGRTAVTVWGDLKIHGEPCVWCGGGRCHSNSTSLCEPFDYLMRGEGKAFDTFYMPHNFKVAHCKAHIPLPADSDSACLASERSGCSAIQDAGTCLMSKDGRLNGTIDGMKINGQPCVWCGGLPCHSGSAAVCEAYDYAMNGEGKAFDYFHGKMTFTFAGCRDGHAAARTYDGFTPYVQGYLHPGYNKSEKILPYWVPERQPEDSLTCLTHHAQGCEAITEMGACLSSRDGRAAAEIKGLKVHGESCVWCGGGACASGSAAKCMPFDYAMRGEGRAFPTFLAKNHFRVAGCYAPYKKPSYDYTCLKPAATGCSAIRDPYACLGSTDGRSSVTMDGLKVQGEPCVWCGGGLCHTGANSMCEPFDYVMNGAGRAFYNFNAKLTYRMAACQDGHPQGATLEGFQSFIPGAIPTVKPFWWITQPKPQGEELSCLMEHRFGCYVVKHKATCLGSRDGRATKEWNGLKIAGEPCVWCGGLPCQSNSTNLCEPYDFLMHGEGKAFHSFYAKTSYNVARCKGGHPLDPELVEATSRDIDVGTGSMIVAGSSNGPVSGGGAGTLQAGHPLAGSTAGAIAGGGAALGAMHPTIAGGAALGAIHPLAGSSAAGRPLAGSSAGVMSPVPTPNITLPSLPGMPIGDCWASCGNKAGDCPEHCGAGNACCKRDEPTDPAECQGARWSAFAGSLIHQCVHTASQGDGVILTDSQRSSNTTALPVGAGTAGFLPPWAMALLGLFLLVCPALVAAYLFCGQSKGKKRRSKRAVSTESTEQNEDSFEAPEQEMNAPLVQQSAGQGLFDAMDRNHDGVVTQEEFNRAMGTTMFPQQGMGGAVPVQTTPAYQMVPGQVTLQQPRVLQARPMVAAVPGVQHQAGVHHFAAAPFRGAPYGAGQHHR